MHVRLGEFDEVGANAIADTARATVQHDPDAIVLIQAQFDEMVAGAQCSQMIDMVATVESAVPGDDLLVAYL